MAFLPVEQQLALLQRGVEKIVPATDLAAKLTKSVQTGQPLRIKYGIDPTGIDVHLGHTVPLRKLRQFQELGHQAVLIIGNYTALVGDPSGRDQARAGRLTEEQVEANAIDYLQQVGKIIDLSRTEVHRNGDWFGTMSFAEILELCSRVTVAQLLTREDFAKRFSTEQPIYLHECLYPLMQAWDSVKIRADVELGGTEQLYTFMLTRDLQRQAGQAEQVGVMSPILVGLDGVRRMGKSLKNYIGISEPAYEMMKKFMQVPDAVLGMYYELLTELSLEEAQKLIAEQPKQAKVKLGLEIIGQYHGAAAAQEAAERWEREISQKSLPDEIPEVSLSRATLAGTVKLVDLVHRHLQLTASSSDARRLIGQGGVWFNDRENRQTDLDAPVLVTDGLIVSAGKKKIVRVRLVD